LTVVVQTANAALYLQKGQAWYWQSDTHIYSVAKGDVDGDGKTEIVTGGYYDDGTRDVAQLCVWNGATLALENVRTWYWTDDTWVMSVAIGDVDGDNGVEIVTGGWHNDGTRWNAQLCVWDGATLALENVKTWYWVKTWDWESYTYIWSVGIGDVDHDGKTEIVTGGHYGEVADYVAQLCVWSGATLALENVKTWYWIGNTEIYSVAVGDVTDDGKTDIVTGGHHYDGTREVAQLCVWETGGGST
jgi:hypothetical protein